MANRRKLAMYPKRKDNARVSLLANPSPPASPSPFLAAQNDPNVSSLYPGTSVVRGSNNGGGRNGMNVTSPSFDQSMATAVEQDHQQHQHQQNQQQPSGTARFAPQHGNNISSQDRELPPDVGALQFVPAFEGSWDADEEKKEDQQQRAQAIAAIRSRQQQQQTQQQSKQQQKPYGSISAVVPRASTTVTGGASTTTATSATNNTTTATTANTTSTASRGGNRIQRLASLFSSRAVVRGDKHASSSPAPAPLSHYNHALKVKEANNGKTTTTNSSPVSSVPASPAHSGASSAYVGWPGTQDRQGGTVEAGSYDDGSLVMPPGSKTASGARAPTTPSLLRAKSAGNTNPNLSYEQELQQAATQEMNRWTGSNFSGSSVGSLTPSPIAKNNLAKHHHHDTKSGNKHNNNRNELELSADFHLRVAVADAKVAAASPLVKQRSAERDHALYVSGSASVAASEAVSFHDLFPAKSNHRVRVDEGPLNQWGDDEEEESSSRVNSSPGGSKTSSAYMNVKDMGFPEAAEYNNYGSRSAAGRPVAAEYNNYGSRSAAGSSSMRPKTGPQPPTMDALATNDRLRPPHRSFNAPGYRGNIDKTKEVPSLMDALDAESIVSSVSPSRKSGGDNNHDNHDHSMESMGDNDSDVFDGLSVSKSDVFDNLSNVDGGGGGNSYTRSGASPRKTKQRSYPEPIVEENESTGGHEDFKMVLLGGGLTAIQTTGAHFSQRQTADDYDDNLTDSDVDQFGFARIPGFNEMVDEGRAHNNSLEGIEGNLGIRNHRSQDPYGRSHRQVERVDSESASGSSLFSDPYGQRRAGEPYEMEGDLSEYYVQASQMKKLVRKYRKMSECVDPDLSFADFEREEDEHKSFAMFEMRSRIMEKDIERGLERRGGTSAVDDLVTTPYNRTAQRIRDAVIVSKAWRDGASPADVVNTALLTRRVDHAHFIKRPIHGNDGSSAVSGYSSSQRYYWEAVKWVDDTDFMQYRCPSLGPRHMRGFEMFTIGDCQSILLRLTNERCKELRLELNAATARQITAEELMKEDGDASDEMMTESEMKYLTSMEEVKDISKQLVIAEQAFTLVRDRVEKLVARYEALLVKFDTAESFAGASSIVTCDSSYYSEYDSEYWEAEDERERVIWARRAQRAELKAELAAREALLAKQEVRMVREEKQRELEGLRQKLVELQSEASHAISEKEHTSILARSFAMRRNDVVSPDVSSRDASTSGKISKGKVDTVKQRFRDRMAAKKQQSASPSIMETPSYGARSQPPPRNITPSPPNRTALLRSAGEEMFQHLDFYERSLKAVDNSHY